MSERLEKLISFVPPCECALDIGCDHGFVAIELVRRGIAGRVIASDVREGPLERAREHIREAGLEAAIEVRMGDGFAAIRPGEAQVCIIAGMGGRLMQRILTEGEACARRMRRLVLQPQSEIPEFRRFLRESGYAIVRNEVLRSDGKWYFPLAAEPEAVAVGDANEKENRAPSGAAGFGVEEDPGIPAELADRYGLDLLCEDRGLAEYLSAEREMLSRLLAELEGQSPPPEQRIAELRAELLENERAEELCTGRKTFFVNDINMT